MLQGEHSARLSTFIKLPFVIKIIVLSIFERPFYNGFNVLYNTLTCYMQNYNILASLCSLADWLKSYLAINPEDRFSPDVAKSCCGSQIFHSHGILLRIFWNGHLSIISL